jgi:hypothetical protein
MNHLHDKEVNELCGVHRTKGEGELVCYSFQQPLQQVVRSVRINKIKHKEGQH